jgi:hypothetical protein
VRGTALGNEPQGCGGGRVGSLFGRFDIGIVAGGAVGCATGGLVGLYGSPNADVFPWMSNVSARSAPWGARRGSVVK